MDNHAINARMEGESVIVRNIGEKRKVSEMELTVLCNLAHLFCLMEFAVMAEDEDLVYKTAAAAERFEASIRRTFAKDGDDDGLYRLMCSCQAILAGDRLARYLVPSDERRVDGPAGR